MTNTLNLSKAYDKGQKAYFQGKTLNNNPYNQSTPKQSKHHADWKHGFNDAKKFREDMQKIDIDIIDQIK